MSKKFKHIIKFQKNVVLNVAILLFVALSVAALLVFFQHRSLGSQQVTITSPYKNYAYNYKGNLHDHSTNSDGSLSPTQVANKYASFGYGFWTQADHNKVTSGPTSIGKMVRLGGAEELSLYNDKTHVLLSVIGSAYPKSNSSTVAAAKAGAIVVLNHFNTSDKKNPAGDEVIMKSSGTTGMEIYNGKRGDENAMELAEWDKMLKAGYKLWGFGADDAHTAAQFGTVGIVVNSSKPQPDRADIVANIKAGNFIVALKNGNPGQLFDLKVTIDNGVITGTTTSGNQISFIANGTRVKTVNQKTASYQPLYKAGVNYVRIEVLNASGKPVAWSQPLYITGGSATANLPKGFTNALYLAANPDVAKAGYDGAWHYLNYGINEDRPLAPLPAGFSATDYLAANPDLKAAGKNAVYYYQRVGFAENRPLKPATPTPAPTPAPAPAPKPTPKPVVIAPTTSTAVVAKQTPTPVVVADKEAPTVPTNVSATYSKENNQINLTWDASRDNKKVAGYEVQKKQKGQDSWDPTGDVALNSYSDYLFASDKTYIYQVRAYDEAKNYSDWAVSPEVVAGSFIPNVTPSNEAVVTDSTRAVTINIPKDAVPSDMFVTVESSTVKKPSMPKGLSPLGVYYEFKVKNSNGEQLDYFKKQIEVKIDYSKVNFSGYKKETIKIVSSTDGGKTFQEMPTTLDGTAATTVTDHFSIYALSAQKTFWGTYLWTIVWATFLALGVLVGFFGWRKYQQSQIEESHAEDFIYKH